MNNRYYLFKILNSYFKNKYKIEVVFIIYFKISIKTYYY